jgi:hypothetical protein
MSHYGHQNGVTIDATFGTNENKVDFLPLIVKAMLKTIHNSKTC